MDAIALVKEWIRGDLEQDKAAKIYAKDTPNINKPLP